MKKHLALHLPLFILALLIRPDPPAGAASLTALELPGGGVPFFESHAYGVSADGSVIVGYASSDQGLGVEPFRHTGGVTSGLGVFNGGTSFNIAYGVSADGSVAVGTSGGEAFRHSGKLMTGLGDLPGGVFDSTARAISGDGSVIVGHGTSAFGVEAFRHSGGAMIGLGDLPGGEFESYALDVSDNGSVIVGTGTTESGYEGFRYSGGVMTAVGDLPGTVATAVSGDGLVIVGGRATASGGEAFRLMDGMMSGLGDLPGGSFSSTAFGVNGDGSVVVGYSHTSSSAEAFIWNENNGMQRVWDVLLAQGIDPAADGWTVLNSAEAISADGKTIVGWGTRNDQAQAFVAVIPEPASFTMLAIGLPLLAGRMLLHKSKEKRSWPETDCSSLQRGTPVVH
jgi:probable HAF family extracellular repeat protein